MTFSEKLQTYIGKNGALHCETAGGDCVYHIAYNSERPENQHSAKICEIGTDYVTLEAYAAATSNRPPWMGKKIIIIPLSMLVIEEF